MPLHSIKVFPGWQNDTLSQGRQAAKWDKLGLAGRAADRNDERGPDAPILSKHGDLSHDFLDEPSVATLEDHH